MNTSVALACAALLAASPAWAAVPDYDAKAIAAPDRPAADTARDDARHTLALLVFSGVKPGDRVADFVPGTGFFTRLSADSGARQVRMRSDMRIMPGLRYWMIGLPSVFGIRSSRKKCTSATAPTTLHRIDPATVKAQVLAAGFVLDTTTDVLANPADPHTAKVFDPAIKGHTDQFAFRFRKPAK